MGDAKVCSINGHEAVVEDVAILSPLEVDLQRRVERGMRVEAITTTVDDGDDGGGGGSCDEFNERHSGRMEDEI